MSEELLQVIRIEDPEERYFKIIDFINNKKELSEDDYEILHGKYPFLV